MSADVFVFVAQHRAPSEADLQAAAARLKGIEIDVNVPPMDLTTHETTFAYVAWTIGAYRVDSITYRGGDEGQRTRLTCSNAGTRTCRRSPTPTPTESSPCPSSSR